MKPKRNFIEILGKWRTHYTGWQLGTRAKGDPEADAVRDHRELTILLRAEVSALTALLVKKGVFTAEEFYDALQASAEDLNEVYARRWPGITASEEGLHYDVRKVQDAGTMLGWKP